MITFYYGVYLIYLSITWDNCMDNEAIIAQLKLHEGVREKPYLDSMKKWTIGVGHNLTDNGLSTTMIDALLLEDIELAKSELDKVYPEWCNLSDNRQMVLVDMSFNLGMPRYLTFKRFWEALRASQYDLAAEEMLDSRWSKQVHNRAITLANMMRKG